MSQTDILKQIASHEGMFQSEIPHSSGACMALAIKKEIIRIPASNGRSRTWRLCYI